MSKPLLGGEREKVGQGDSYTGFASNEAVSWVRLLRSSCPGTCSWPVLNVQSPALFYLYLLHVCCGVTVCVKSSAIAWAAGALRFSLDRNFVPKQLCQSDK